MDTCSVVRSHQYTEILNAYPNIYESYNLELNYVA